MVDKKIRVCCGMTCSVMGSGKVMKKLEETTGLKQGESKDGVDLNYCACTGYCHMAPSVVVNGNFIHEANPDTIVEEIEKVAGLPPQDTGVSDATLEEIMNNDFLGDI